MGLRPALLPDRSPNKLLDSREAMKWICAVAAASAMAASALPARAAVIPDCPVPPGVVKADLRSGLPPALLPLDGATSLCLSEPFDTTDVYTSRGTSMAATFSSGISASGGSWRRKTRRHRAPRRHLCLRARQGRQDRRPDQRTRRIFEQRMRGRDEAGRRVSAGSFGGQATQPRIACQRLRGCVTCRRITLLSGTA